MTKSQLQGIKKVQGEIQDLGSAELYNDLTQEQRDSIIYEAARETPVK